MSMLIEYHSDTVLNVAPRFMSVKNWQGKIMHIELGIEKNKVDFYQDRVVSYYLLYIWFYKVILLLINPLPVVNFTVVKF